MHPKHEQTTKFHIRTGDLVQVNAGNHKDKSGEVTFVDRKKSRAIVKGINLLTHYVKPTQQNQKGGIEQKEGSLHISNLVLLDPKTKKPVRVGRKKNEKGKLQRYDKKTGKFI